MPPPSRLLRTLAPIGALLPLAACDVPPSPEQAALPGQESAVLARVGSRYRPASTRPPQVAEMRKLGIRTRNALRAFEPFEVDVPDAARRLAFSTACVSLAPGGEELRGPCRGFRIERIDGRGGDGDEVLFEGAGRADWEDRDLDLPPGEGRVLRFSLDARPAGTEPLWGSLLLLGPPEEPMPNVVLVSLDTLGALSLGSFAGPEGADVSPRIDALLAASADFRSAQAQYGNTLVSHASLFSALYPRRHGIYPDVLPGPLESSLVGALAEAGYRTVAFTEGAFVSAAFGFAEGFDAYDDGKIGLSQQMAGGAARTFARAGAWLEEAAGRGPFFLFLHTYEVHMPYLPEGDSARVAGALTPGDGRSFPAALQTRVLLDYNAGRSSLPARDRERLLALHRGEVHTLDRILGGFVERLESGERAGSTLLVVTADHGDQFGEWGKLGHGESLHDRVVHVPLAFHWPGVIEPRRIEQPVQLVDVMPTVLELLGRSVPGDRDGASLAAAIRGGEAPERPAFSEQRTAPGECARLGEPQGCRLDRIAVRSGRWKLISSILPRERRLYDLAADPEARRDVAAEHPETATRLEALVEAYRSGPAAEPQPGGDGIDMDTLRRLRELGYTEEPGS